MQLETKMALSRSERKKFLGLSFIFQRCVSPVFVQSIHLSGAIVSDSYRERVVPTREKLRCTSCRPWKRRITTRFLRETLPAKDTRGTS